MTSALRYKSPIRTLLFKYSKLNRQIELCFPLLSIQYQFFKSDGLQNSIIRFTSLFGGVKKNMSLFPCLNLNVLNFVFFNACLHILVVKCYFIYKYIKLLKTYRSFPLLKISLKRTNMHFCYRKNKIKEQKITYIFMDDLRFKT